MAAIAKSCGAPLVPADLLASEGLGVTGLAASCACLARQLACRVDQLSANTTPRLGELLDLGGVTLP